MYTTLRIQRDKHRDTIGQPWLTCGYPFPRYAGFLKGLLQVFSYLAGGIAPTVAGFFISQVSPNVVRNINKSN